MIGGNITALLQVRTTTKNAIGEAVEKWHTVMELKGWLDLQSGNSNYQTFNAKIQESTHVFVCDYKPIPGTLDVDGKTVNVSSENARMVTGSMLYDVMLIDDPMELHEQLEIYLKFTGGQ